MDRFDVIVVGGGTAGTAAAVAAAREGASTLVVEKSGALGGTSTLGLVTPLMRNEIDGVALNQGLNREIVARYGEACGLAPRDGDFEWFDPVLLSVVLEEIVREAGAEILYDAVVSAVRTDAGRITDLEATTRGGTVSLTADVIIDASGDAFVARMAGCPVEVGNEAGQNQPMSLRFILGSVAIPQVVDSFQRMGVACQQPMLHVGFHEAKDGPMGQLVRKAVADEILAEDDLGYFQFFAISGRPTELAFNCPRLAGFDVLDPWQVSKAYTVGRQKIMRIIRFLRERIPGFANANLINVAPMIGIRESVRIVGEYTLSEDDYMHAKHFPDAVARSRYPIDIHNPSGQGTTLIHLPEGQYHEIPYRCLLPRRVDNLLVTGRCIAASFPAQAAVRIIPNCRTLGEAAGIAAAMAVGQGVTVRSIAGQDVRAKMTVSN